MPQFVLDKVKTLLQMRSDTRDIRLSNDRPNVHLATLQMLDPLNSCHDIVCVLQFNGDPPPPPFMVFCNDHRETEHLCLYAHLLAPAHFVDKLLWFHSGMSTHFCTDTIEKLHTHKIWGIFLLRSVGRSVRLGRWGVCPECRQGVERICRAITEQVQRSDAKIEVDVMHTWNECTE
jgi:hypothetical protein